MPKPRIRVAVVDDDASVRRALGRLLKSASFDAAVYPTGGEFLDNLDAFQPRCIILDLHMPGLNGLDIQRHLVRIKSCIPVIVITGHDSQRARDEALVLGACAYFAKPLESTALIAEIQKVTDRPTGPLPR